MYGLIFFIIGCGVGHFEKKIGQAEFDHWRALRIYMDEDTQKQYRKFKTKEELNISIYLGILGISS